MPVLRARQGGNPLRVLTMKRMRPDQRRQVVRDFLAGLERTWLCRHGQWNRDKLLMDLENELKQRRKGRSNGKAK